MEDKMGGACSMHGGDEKFIQNFSGETWRDIKAEIRPGWRHSVM
jgi:hypothetical protein